MTMQVFSTPSFSTSSPSKGTPYGTVPDDQASNAGDAPDANTAVADSPAQSNAKPDPQNVPQGLLCPNPAAGHRPEQDWVQRLGRSEFTNLGLSVLEANSSSTPTNLTPTTDSNTPNPGASVGQRFTQGAAHGAVDMVYQPLAQLADLGQASYGLAKGGTYEPRWFSSIGQNYAGGMGYGETITRAVLDSNPVTGVGMANYDLTSSALQGDWAGVAQGMGGVAGGIVAGKYVKRAFAPEPGAQLGIKRLGTSLPHDVVDSAGISGGKLPPLPSGKTGTFTGIPVPRQFRSGELKRVWQAGNSDAPLSGRYWATETPTSEAMWRGPYAVLKDWGNAGTDVATLQRPNTWAWYGKTSAMAVPRNSITVGQHAIGWYQPGGAPQAMIPNSFSIVNPSNVTTARTPWHRP